jgi:hypothetical protein
MGYKNDDPNAVTVTIEAAQAHGNEVLTAYVHDVPMATVTREGTMLCPGLHGENRVVVLSYTGGASLVEIMLFLQGCSAEFYR